MESCKKLKAIIWAIAFKVIFVILGSSTGFLPPVLFTPSINYSQLGLIGFYDNFHLKWPLHESKFISKVRTTGKGV